MIYGINLLLAALANIALQLYIQKSKNIENGEITSRLRKQGNIRRGVMIIFFVFGIIASLSGMYYISIIFYIVPIVFSNIPGSLDLMERIFGFELT